MMFTIESIEYTAASGGTKVSILEDDVVGVSFLCKAPYVTYKELYKDVYDALRDYVYDVCWEDNDVARHIRFFLALKSISLDGIGPVPVGSVFDLASALCTWYQCRKDLERVIELTDKGEGTLFKGEGNRFLFCMYSVEDISPAIEEWLENEKEYGYLPCTDDKNSLFRGLYYSDSWLIFKKLPSYFRPEE